MLERDEDVNEVIKEAIEKLMLPRLIPIALGEGTSDGQISHQIIHSNVEPHYYTRHTMIMASEYVENTILRRDIGAREERLKSFIAACKGLTFMTSVCGPLFEPYANQKVSAGGGGEFLMRSWDKEREWKLKCVPWLFNSPGHPSHPSCISIFPNS